MKTVLQQIFYQGPPQAILHNHYAKQGRLDEAAPIRSSSSIVIAAPVAQIWAVVINLPAWPFIAPIFQDVKLASTVAVDAEFSFRLNNFPIRARFAVVQPNAELTWTGTSLWFTAIDRITLTALSVETTRLSMEESFSGILAKPLMNSSRLQAQHRQWLEAIKRAVEHN